MDTATANTVRDRLPAGRTLFHWFHDRDAFVLLAWETGAGTGVRALRDGPRAALMNRPSVRVRLGQIGRTALTTEDFEAFWPAPVEVFRMSFGQWPLEDDPHDRYYDQQTRTGHHLVVRLDLPKSHLRDLKAQLGKDDWVPLRRSHPISGDETDLTLAWARVDLSLDTGEALIEELQSDWVRDVLAAADYEDGDDGPFKRYVKEQLPALRRLWPKAMLLATLEVLRGHLGIRRIFCHSPVAGARLKRIGGSLPPRSIYSELPRRFTFQKTWNPPDFLLAHRSVRLRKELLDPKTWWWVLEV